MVARSILAHHLRQSTLSLRSRNVRLLTTSTPPTDPSSSRPPPPPSSQTPPKREGTWLTNKLKESPAAKAAFIKLANVMGYGTWKQYAGRRSLAMYSNLCVPRPDEDADFWRNECHLPPTFQSWFTVTNLHVWLLTVRLRALPPPHGNNYVQGLIDHFFIDVEDRIRAVLQPASPTAVGPSYNREPYTKTTDFYTIANGGQKRPRGRAPEALVTKQMKIFKEQWAGMGMSFDLGLVRSDAEMAAAVWRNLLGARGARGIAYPSPDGLTGKPYFRRTVNLVGGEVEKVAKIEKLGLEVEEARDDGSGVYDYPPAEADKYVAYPELMATVVEYVRRELVRLQNDPDALIIGKGVVGTESHDLEPLRFGRVRQRL